MIVNIHVLYRFADGQITQAWWHGCDEDSADTIIKAVHVEMKSSETLTGYTLSVERRR